MFGAKEHGSPRGLRKSTNDATYVSLPDRFVDRWYELVEASDKQEERKPQLPIWYKRSNLVYKVQGVGCWIRLNDTGRTLHV